jgi:hypothetical protein
MHSTKSPASACVKVVTFGTLERFAKPHFAVSQVSIQLRLAGAWLIAVAVHKHPATIGFWYQRS